MVTESGFQNRSSLSLFVILIGLIGLFGCGGEHESDGVSSQMHPVDVVFTDPFAVTFDRASPMFSFGKDGGSLMLGRGWAPRNKDGGGFFAWAIDGVSEAYFRRPSAANLDFFARCKVPGYLAEAGQTVRIYINQAMAGEFVIDGDGWQDHRIPIESSNLVDGLNHLSLRFSIVKSPRAAGKGADNRKLTVAFRQLALIPRAVRRPNAFIHASRYDSDTKTLVVPEGGEVEIPMPRQVIVKAQLGEVTSTSTDSVLIIEVCRLLGGCSDLWRGEPTSATGQNLQFAAPGEDLTQLVFRLVGPGGVKRGAAEWAGIGLGPESFDFEPADITEAGQSRPNVFIYLVDALRADSLELYGGRRGTSPELQKFAEDAVTYRRATAASTWTLPSVVSVMTGLYSARHGIMQGFTRLTADHPPTLASRLSAQQYSTVGISQSLVISPRLGLDTGFDTFFYSNQLSGRILRSEEVRNYFMQWLQGRPGETRPLFAYIHTVGPHAPYAPVGRFRKFADEAPGNLGEDEYNPVPFMVGGHNKDEKEVAHLRARYDGEVQYADAQFGRFVDLLKFLGLYEDSLIFFVSDHGEEFNDHGGFDHGRTVYEELTHVPLLVKFPGGKWAGQQVETRVSNVDIVATIADVLGLDWGALDGISLSPEVIRTREGEGAMRGVFAEVNPKPSKHRAGVNYRAALADRVKCIESLGDHDQFAESVPRWQVFDLEADPNETKPLPADGELSAECQKILGDWVAAAQAGGADVEDEITDDDTWEKLRALGYVD